MRYAIVSDIHANLPALRAVLSDLAAQSIDAMICLGDAVGYYADGAAGLHRRWPVRHAAAMGRW